MIALALLIAAGQGWMVEPGQALVSIEVNGLSAVSHQLTGTVRPLDGGALEVQVRLPLASLIAEKPVNTAAAGEAVFEGSAAEPGEGAPLHLAGTLTFHGVRKTVALQASLARVGRHAFAHALLVLHLRDFGFTLPEGAPDLARVEIDAGLRPEGVLASR
jgi:polyisoprenoid-binding protein YceI